MNESQFPMQNQLEVENGVAARDYKPEKISVRQLWVSAVALPQIDLDTNKVFCNQIRLSGIT